MTSNKYIMLPGLNYKHVRIYEEYGSAYILVPYLVHRGLSHQVLAILKLVRLEL